MKEFLSLESATEIFTRATAARNSGDKTTSIELFGEVIDQSDDKNLVVAAIDGLQTFEENERVVAAVETALSRWPSSPMFLLRGADACGNIGNFDGATRYLLKITELYPTKARYLLRLADTFAAAGKWDDAEANYAKTLTIAPLDPAAALGHGESLFQLGRIDDAIARYRRITKFLPDHAESAVRLGNLLSASNDLDEAIEVLRRAVHLNPKNASAHASLGSTLHYNGHDNEGLALCRKAMELEPELTIAREATGILLLEGGHVAEATELLDSVDRAQASIPGLIAKYAVAILAENSEAAERALQRALSLNAHHGEARHLLAAMHGEPVARPAEGFVESVFTRLAHRYDRRMTVDLDYQIPHLVASAVADAQKNIPSPAPRWLDLGCGSGLVAVALEKVIETTERVGVDLTQGMLNQAAKKDLYDHLILGDAIDALREMDRRFDLITAVDLLAYIGDASDFFSFTQSRLAPGGMFVYTHEQAMEGTFKLRSSGRFAYDTGYLERLEAKAHLEVVSRKPVTLTYDKGEEVSGFLVTLTSRRQ